MTEQEHDLMESYFNGSLSEADKQTFEDRLKTDATFSEKVKDFQAVNAILEHKVEEDLRTSFKKIQQEKEPKKSILNRYWILVTIIGGLIIAGITLTKKLGDISKDDIARQYAIMEVADRDRTPYRIIDTVLFEQYVDHLKLANQLIETKNYSAARESIAKITYNHNIARDNAEWMNGLTYYLENGRSDAEFHRILNKILDNPDHTCYQMAVDLDSQVNSFWGRLKE